MYLDVVKGGADTGAYLQGANKLENMFRASMGFVGKGVDNNLGFAIANAPNRLIQLRNEMRFDLSPMFSFRRAYKIAAKGALEGINPVWNGDRSY